MFFAAILAGCVWLGEDEFAERIDADGDASLEGVEVCNGGPRRRHG